MPSEKIEKSSNLMLKQFKTMEVDIPQNNSQAELLRSSSDNSPNHRSNIPEVQVRTLKDVTKSEWIAVFILCFVNLINYMDRFTLAGILDDITKYFGVNEQQGGLLQTVFVISYMIFGPIFGYLGDRYNRSTLMTAGVFLWSLTTLTGSFMNNYWWFLLFRGLVGIGEASYATIAPTIISDLFSGDMRSQMLAIFYFAIPVGSGLGYIVGSETAAIMGSWKWALRVTPGLGIVAVLLIYFVLKDPERGESEGGGHMEVTSYAEDIKDIVQNRSFMLSTAGFTCVAFVTGALSWWGPSFLKLGLKLQDKDNTDRSKSVGLMFGAVAMVGGIMGVPAGSYLAQRLRPMYSRIDAHICGVALLISSPFVFFGLITAGYSTNFCYFLILFGEFFFNLTWSIVADILLYVVLPTRRSSAEGFQLLFSHAFGDAGSPYLVGVLTDSFGASMNKTSNNATADSDYIKFKSMQYALFSTCFVEILGGFFFLVTAFYILEDKRKVEKAMQDQPHHNETLDNTSPSASEIE